MPKVIRCAWVDIDTIGNARIFDWRGANHKSHAMTSSEIFERNFFVGQRYRRMEDQKPWPGFSPNQDFAKGRRFKPKSKKCKCLNWGTCSGKQCNSNASQMGGGGGQAPGTGQFFAIFFWPKKAILMPLDHISHVFETICKNKILNI